MESVKEVKKERVEVTAFGTDEIKFGRKPVRAKRQACSGNCNECLSVLC